MRFLTLALLMSSLSWISLAEPVQEESLRVRTELDEVLEEQGARPAAPRLDPFWSTPHLSDFPRFGFPYQPGYDRFYFYGGSSFSPRPPFPHRPSLINKSGWEKVHKRRGDIEIVNGESTIVAEDSHTTSIGGVNVPAWANWWRFSGNGSVEFAP